MITDNAGVRVQEAATCLLCGRTGVQLYSSLADRLHDAPGLWNLRSCWVCGLAWLDPQPIDDDVGKLYGSYYTHQRSAKWQPGSVRWKLREAVRNAVLSSGHSQCGRGWRFLGIVAAKSSAIKDWAADYLLWIESGKGQTLLEIGCGNGGFLLEMKRLGWRVLGVEPDPRAARVARQTSSSTVFGGRLEDASLPDSSIDLIVMHHVIEHLREPVATLRECRRVLRMGGKVIVVTPNLEGLGHRYFRQSWVHLDPPRHLYLFTSRSLRECAQKAGLELRVQRTSSRWSSSTWVGSLAIKRAGTPEWAPGWITNLKARAFFIVEGMAQVFWPVAGEELLMIASKPGRG